MKRILTNDAGELWVYTWLENEDGHAILHFNESPFILEDDQHPSEMEVPAGYYELTEAQYLAAKEAEDQADLKEYNAAKKASDKRRKLLDKLLKNADDIIGGIG